MSDNRRCAMCGRWSHRSRFCDQCRDCLFYAGFVALCLVLFLAAFTWMVLTL
jgi:hypothetical protein